MDRVTRWSISLCMDVVQLNVQRLGRDDTDVIKAAEYTVSGIFALELTSRAVAFSLVNGHLCPTFFKDPFTCIDIAVVALDIAFIIFDQKSGFHKAARAIKMLRLGRMARSARLLKRLHAIRSANTSRGTYSLATKIADGVSIDIEKIAIHMLAPDEESSREWLGMPSLRSTESKDEPVSLEETSPEERNEQLGSDKKRKRRPFSMFSPKKKPPQDSNDDATKQTRGKTHVSSGGERARQLASFPSYQVIEILNLRVLNVDASFTNHVSKLSHARVAGKLEGSEDAGLRMFKKINIGSIAMHTIDERGEA